MPARLRIVVIVLASLWTTPALAYRPFEGTDADVLEAGNDRLRPDCFASSRYRYPTIP